MRIKHPIYTHVQYQRPMYNYTPTLKDYRPPINTWNNEKTSLIERIKCLELKVCKMEYLLDRYGVKE